MSNTFKNRVYGCAIIKSINSNYNADFSHQPRTLPNGVVYATDKALKWSVRNYWKQVANEIVFYSKSLDDNMSPRTLDETFEKHFGRELFEKNKSADKKNDLRLGVLKNILSCIDVRLFGGTYAGKTNISLHGTCQISHGVNRFSENVIYSEQIMSPFRNSGESSNDSTMTTLGTQSKLAEGHYVHHFSVNPKNIEADVERVKATGISVDDISKLKDGLRKGVSYYDSAAKIGTDNECLVWVQLKEGSKAILPSFVELVVINNEKEIDLSGVSALLKKHKDEIEKIEVFYDKVNTKVIGLPEGAIALDI
jgi:CRISPR-associated protein Csh2